MASVLRVYQEGSWFYTEPSSTDRVGKSEIFVASIRVPADDLEAAKRARTEFETWLLETMQSVPEYVGGVKLMAVTRLTILKQIELSSKLRMIAAELYDADWIHAASELIVIADKLDRNSVDRSSESMIEEEEHK